MRLRELESDLQCVQSFTHPKVCFEQYPTSPHLASRMLYTADTMYDDIDGKNVADLGTGCGMLTFAALRMGAAYTLSVDIDPDALAVARANAARTHCTDDLNAVCADVTTAHLIPTCAAFDTVVMNPPFGTKHSPGLDMRFLEHACTLAPVVYSLHKSSTRTYLTGACERRGWRCDVLAEVKFDIPNMYKFHKRASVDIRVDLIRVSRECET